MNIGKKIKSIREEKLMTQSELAGDMITRNMISQIENGTAQPSLSTIIFIADRLSVPAGYLLSEGEEEFVFHKTRIMRDIKRAYCDKNYELCRDICLSSFKNFDDELELIYIDCCIGVAEEYIKGGKLYAACEILDDALRHMKKTIYSTVCQKNKIYIMFYLIKSISPMLDSNEIETDISDDILNPLLFDDIFGIYLSLILKNIEKDKTADDIFGNAIIEDSESYELDNLFILHIKARICISKREYKKAVQHLKAVIDGEFVPPRLLLYLCCGDMEKCCKEMEDYKSAYEFSNNKMEILEHMLADN